MNDRFNKSVNTTQYFNYLMQLNPFDAVVVLKHEQHDCFTVQLTNEKADALFQSTHQFAMREIQYFSLQQWQQLLPLLQQSKNRHVIQLSVSSSENMSLAVHVTKLEWYDEVYYTIVFRYSGESKNRHLAFVEQNIHPMISVDLTGKIIYYNQSMHNKLTKANNTILEKNIQHVISEHCQEEFLNVYTKTLEGISMSMPKCTFTERGISDELYHLKLLPTYWEGQMIGMHIVLKDTYSFYSESAAYQYFSLRDELTGLFNRSALKEHWKNEFDPIAVQQSIAFMLIDLDRFKKFNESLGETRGDELIIDFCARLQSLNKDNIRLYRYSGDEFVFIFKNYSRADVEQFAQNVLHALKVPFIVDSQEYFITVSIGIALSPTDGSDLETLVRKADQALFHVKEQGRANFKFYRDEMAHAFPNEALMEAHLRRAIEFNELAIHLQPQINLQTNEIDSFEALLRWHNRKFGFVSPAQFIPIAEASGLIIEIGDWILETVCRYQAEWRKRGYRPVRIAVNISPKQFSQENFARKIEEILKKYDVNPRYIELEITESSMTNINETYSILTELKRLGIYVSVDDFGTGYSSLSYLKRYPIDIIKIDQSFIADIEKDEKNEAIIKAIILLSHSLGLEVVAEGVEQKVQEDFLKAYSCQKVQGYYYNKPLPVEEMVKQYLIH